MSPTFVKCPKCQGQGWVAAPGRRLLGPKTVPARCLTCMGTGRVLATELELLEHESEEARQKRMEDADRLLQLQEEAARQVQEEMARQALWEEAVEEESPPPQETQPDEPGPPDDDIDAFLTGLDEGGGVGRGGGTLPFVMVAVFLLGTLLVLAVLFFVIQS